MDLAARLGVVGEAVVRRDGVGEAAIDIETQQRAQQRGAVLARALGIVAGAAVADADEQHALVVEGEHAALVHGAERGDDQQGPLGVLERRPSPSTVNSLIEVAPSPSLRE